MDFTDDSIEAPVMHLILCLLNIIATHQNIAYFSVCKESM